ncbi:MAG: 30S ribosomal protein S1 [Clostridiales bacterium 38-18]|nr:MAG: 30S ribosomal protein S1 [Clostridiales bacterium 38-18]
MENQTMDEMLNQFGMTEKLYTGDVVEGTVISSNADEVMVNIRYMADGILPKAELPDGNPLDFREGDQIKVYVMKLDDGDGNVMLSLTKAYELIIWDEFQELFDAGKTFKVKVKEAVKGGVVALYRGARVFIPASQLSLSFVSELNVYLGNNLEVKLTEYSAESKKVVASHKVILQNQLAVKKADLISRISPEDKLTGTVVRIADYGAFVDLGGVDGLIHISQLSWKRVKHPSEVLKEGDVVEVIVLSVDRDKEKISLKLAQIQQNPWETISDRYAVEDIIIGKVTKYMTFGVFVEVEEGVEGLIHISELSEEHVNRPQDVVKIGDEVEAMIIELDAAAHRMSLSMKAVASIDEADYEAFEQDEVQNTTLSDLFGDKLKNLKLK